jgi:hypothetical protein
VIFGAVHTGSPDENTDNREFETVDTLILRFNAKAATRLISATNGQSVLGFYVHNQSETCISPTLIILIIGEIARSRLTMSAAVPWQEVSEIII